MKVRLSRIASNPARLPRVQVVIPCYNYGQYLSDCVSSALQQPNVDVRVLITDDASTDGSADIAEALAHGRPEVSVVRHKRNQGHIANYNQALSQVDSDYVVLLSADDLLAPGALTRATGFMEALPTVGLVYGHPQNFATAPNMRSRRSLTWSTWNGHDWIRAQFRRGLSIIYSPEAVVRTSVHHEVGYYNPDLPHSADLELWLRIAAVSDVGRVNGADQAYRRVHALSMMQTEYGDVMADLEERVRAYQSFLTHVDSPKEYGRLSSIMRRRASNEAIEWALSAAGTDAAERRFRAAEFVRRVNPAVESSHLRRELGAEYKAAGGGASDLGVLMSQPRMAYRDLANRVRWRRWRYLGI